MSDELVTAITSFVSAFLLFVVVKVTTIIKRKIKEVREETDMTVIIHEGDKIIVTDALQQSKHTCVCTVRLQVMENGDPVWYLDEITPVDTSKDGDSDDTESDSLSS